MWFTRKRQRSGPQWGHPRKGLGFLWSSMRIQGQRSWANNGIPPSLRRDRRIPEEKSQLSQSQGLSEPHQFPLVTMGWCHLLNVRGLGENVVTSGHQALRRRLLTPGTHLLTVGAKSVLCSATTATSYTEERSHPRHTEIKKLLCAYLWQKALLGIKRN